MKRVFTVIILVLMLFASLPIMAASEKKPEVQIAYEESFEMVPSQIKSGKSLGLEEADYYFINKDNYAIPLLDPEGISWFENETAEYDFMFGGLIYRSFAIMLSNY